MILWVDDCRENNVYIRSILENYGLKFDLALNTERAMRFLNSNRYLLVISDMGRKEGPFEGYVLLKQIRDSGNNIPFFLLVVVILHIKRKRKKGERRLQRI
jgi:PleD family two-component response regulator